MPRLATSGLRADRRSPCIHRREAKKKAELPLGLSAAERFLVKVAGAAGRRARGAALAAEESRGAVRDTQAHAMRIIAGRGADILQDDPHLEACLRELCSELGLLLDQKYVDPAQRRVCFAPTAESFPPDVMHVPMGYPNYIEHPVCERPFLGYSGFRHMVDRTAAAILRGEAGANPRS